MKLTPAMILLMSALAFANAQAALPPAAAQAEKAGIKTCLPVIESVENFLARGQNGTSLAFWDTAAADRNLFTAVLALENQNGNSIVNLNVAPATDGQCVVEYALTTHIPMPCVEYAKTLGPNAKYVRDINSRTAFFQGKGGMYFLSPTGPNGCLLVRKEILKQPPSLKQPAQAKPADNKSSTKKR